MKCICSPCRIIRRKEILAWHGDGVMGMRKQINNRAHMFLIAYTLVVVWINLCYVATFDTPTIWYARKSFRIPGFEMLTLALVQPRLSVYRYEVCSVFRQRRE